ncbi:hypothetical protein CGLO_06804 [Colletotrichum gloeosporioides Cg-14]|uniref:ToxB-like N-terminal ascomycota domain-containing protein n=1 Tax=Colletotrichum gloeosporioides (strain Cg-14) TaxID=1237896 RepID=T0KDJ7_COLGC|nr:hypothetical protein CGLO_06804 [Colletotrichum gloeosporioides Cg-14]
MYTMAQFVLIFAALFAALAYAAPANGTTNASCLVQFEDSINGGTAGSCSQGSASAGVRLPSGGPYVQYTISKSCELAITNGPLDGVTGTATIVASC